MPIPHFPDESVEPELAGHGFAYPQATAVGGKATTQEDSIVLIQMRQNIAKDSDYRRDNR